MRIGVFICHCGKNVAGSIEIAKVVDSISKYPDVVCVKDYKYFCSEPGQQIISDSIYNDRLDCVVVAACSPTLHETTFRNLCKRKNINYYLCEIANIREQCSWVHSVIEKCTEKSIKIIQSVIEKIKFNEPLEAIGIEVTKTSLVIGGGIAGIQTALDIANSGYKVYMVEKTPTIGGHMAQLSETFPTLDCSQCILTPKMVELARHPNIELLTMSEVISVEGYVGNFKVTVLQHPRYVEIGKCNLCGECEKVCPRIVDDDFNCKLIPRKAIYIPFPQAVPSAYAINEKNCEGIIPLRCTKCLEVCEPKAINFDEREKIIELNVGTIVIATGYQMYPIEKIAEYGYGKYTDVIDSLQFERLLSSTGPTEGVIKRPSDSKIPKSVAFIQCIGSRDPEQHLPYCSKICCMYTAKHVLLYKEKVPEGTPYVFYIDIRAAGKGYEEFITRITEDKEIIYIRGKVSKIYQSNGKLLVYGVDTLSVKPVKLSVDMVVLAPALIPDSTSADLAKKLKISIDSYGFYSEAHPKLKPVEVLSQGIYLAGNAHSPKDITESVTQASGSAAKVLTILTQDKIYQEPIIAKVTDSLCSGCKSCISICPFGAITYNLSAKIVQINSILCNGCGGCAVVCPSHAIEQNNFKSIQFYNMIDGIMGV